MKTLKLIKKILFTIIGVSYYVFALCMTILLLNYNDYNVTQFGEKSLVIINDTPTQYDNIATLVIHEKIEYVIKNITKEVPNGKI